MKYGVIATEGTIKSKAWETEIKKEIPSIEVINKACPMLAEVAEKGLARSPEGRRCIKEYMRTFKERGVQDIILGCTHYPIYEEIIREELGYDVNLINTGKAVSKYLKEFLYKNNMENNGENTFRKIFLSKHTSEFKNIALNILPEKYTDINIEEIN